MPGAFLRGAGELRCKSAIVSAMLDHYDAGSTLRTYTHITRPKQGQAAQATGCNVVLRSFSLKFRTFHAKNTVIWIFKQKATRISIKELEIRVAFNFPVDPPAKAVRITGSALCSYGHLPGDQRILFTQSDSPRTRTGGAAEPPAAHGSWIPEDPCSSCPHP